VLRHFQLSEALGGPAAKMQRVTSILPSWDKTKTISKKGLDKTWALADKLGAPVNRLSNKIGSEAFWPTTLDKECDKAARILKSFCSMISIPILPYFRCKRLTVDMIQRMDSMLKTIDWRQSTHRKVNKGS